MATTNAQASQAKSGAAKSTKKKSRKKKFDDWIERNSNWENSKNHKLYALREQKENELLEKMYAERKDRLNAKLQDEDRASEDVDENNSEVEQ